MDCRYLKMLVTYQVSVQWSRQHCREPKPNPNMFKHVHKFFGYFVARFRGVAYFEKIVVWRTQVSSHSFGWDRIGSNFHYVIARVFKFSCSHFLYHVRYERTSSQYHCYWYLAIVGSDPLLCMALWCGCVIYNRWS